MRKDSNPEHWKLIFIYYNPENPYLWVARRSGLPVTLNFAKPMAWVLTGVCFALALSVFIVNN